jgi:hypothetical protein
MADREPLELEKCGGAIEQAVTARISKRAGCIESSCSYEALS